MPKIMILGSQGMAGHTIYNYLKSLNKYSITITGRENKFPYPTYLIDIEKSLSYLKSIITNQDIVINCIGLLVKACEENPAKAIYINSYFPHWLENITKNTTTKIIHLSTDCVFSGKKGSYFDTDIKDGIGWYAKTKSLGEIINNKDLTIRMSIIGKELKKTGSDLLEWFLRQKGTIRGYNKCYWSGITTLLLAQNIDKLIDTNTTGLYQLAPSYKVSKYNLLNIIKEVWNKDIIIKPDDKVIHDKSLVNSYRENFQPIIPINYKEMIEEYYDYCKLCD